MPAGSMVRYNNNMTPKKYYTRFKRRFVKAYKSKRSSGFNKIHKFIQTVSVPNVALVSNATVASDTPYAFTFRLTDLDQQTSFTTLFDQYKFDKVVITFQPRAMVVSVQGANNSQQTVPTYWLSAIDYDDGNNLVGGLPTIREYSNCVTHSVNDKAIKITIRPHMAQAVLGGGVFTSYGNKRAGWIDAASPTVQHFGLKLMFPATNAVGITNTFAYDVVAKYYISMKNVR